MTLVEVWFGHTRIAHYCGPTANAHRTAEAWGRRFACCRVSETIVEEIRKT